ncbi:MAG: IS4 family transposase [Gammaproteobacteria bacterium]|nr:IS4 family transposase [Gammaproteobacteria bacterium]
MGIHAKRVESLSNGVIGVLTSGSLAIHAMGAGYAAATGHQPRHGIKQIDRLLSNRKIDVQDCHRLWVPYVIGSRQDIMVAMDWTDFDEDGHATLAINLTTQHGRATPLVWRSVKKGELKDNRNRYEDELLAHFKSCLPEDVHVTLLADRGFCDTELFASLTNLLKFDYVIRIRKNLMLTNQKGEMREANKWLTKGRKTALLREVTLTHYHHPITTAVVTKQPKMKELWCLVSSLGSISSQTMIAYYAKRWGVETWFRDSKSARYGLGMGAMHTSSTTRRDRLWLLAALAVMLMTLMGQVSEELGYDRTLKANTVKKRTHSLFRQGLMIYEAIPQMPEQWLRPIMTRFSTLLLEFKHYQQLFGVV